MLRALSENRMPREIGAFSRDLMGIVVSQNSIIIIAIRYTRGRLLHFVATDTARLIILASGLAMAILIIALTGIAVVLLVRTRATDEIVHLLISDLLLVAEMVFAVIVFHLAGMLRLLFLPLSHKHSLTRKMLFFPPDEIRGSNPRVTRGTVGVMWEGG